MRPALTLAGAAACLGALASAGAGVLDVGLVFPRANETYELGPDDDFSVVFAVQNLQAAEHLNAQIEFKIANLTRNEVGHFGDDVTRYEFDLGRYNWTNGTSAEPYLRWHNFRIDTEGPFRVVWDFSWASCDEGEGDDDPVRTQSNSAYQANGLNNFLVDFEIIKRGGKVDLVAATANTTDAGDECPNDGITVEVTDKTHADVPVSDRTSDGTRTCAVLASSSTTPTSNPCKVKLDKATVESMEAADFERACRSPWPPADCPEEDAAVATLAAAGVSGLAALLGAVFFLA